MAHAEGSVPPAPPEATTDVGEEGLAVRIGLGYVAGVQEADVREIVAERERGGPFRSVTDLAARCRARQDTLERLAWAGACDSLVGGTEATARRRALWLLGVSVPGVAVGTAEAGGTQLALPLDPHDVPELRELTPWERLVADYGSTKVTLREHPLELMRPTLAEGVLSSEDLPKVHHGARVQVAGLVVARQRPATAKGVTFMLLEDEHGTVNLVVPPPVHDACRVAVRAEPLVLAEGKLEHREGVTNVVVSSVRRLERPDLPLGEVRHIEPQRTWSGEAGAAIPGAAEAPGAADDLRAALPAAHSFGRRGR